MDIAFTNIITRCKAISDYEATRAKDSQGESLYEVVAMEDQDEDLIKEYANESAGLIAKELRFAMNGVSYASDKISFTFITDTSLHGSNDNMKKDIEGTIVAYILWNWMSNKVEMRANVWKSIYETMLASLPKGVYRKRPSLN